MTGSSNERCMMLAGVMDGALGALNLQFCFVLITRDFFVRLCSYLVLSSVLIEG